MAGATLLVNTPLGVDFGTSNTPIFGVRNGHRYLEFGASADEEAYFTNVLPEGFANLDLNFEIQWMAETATTGDVLWEVSIERHDGSTDLDSDSFATAKTVVDTAPGTSGIISTARIEFGTGEIDGLLRGEQFRIKVRRVGTDSSDTMTGGAQLTSIAIKQDTAIAGGGGGGGFFSAGTGSYAVIGQGASPPVASGDRSMAQGTYVDVSGYNSLGLGDTVNLDGDNSLAIGKTITIDNPANDNSCAIGLNIDHGTAQESLSVGRDITLFNGANLAVGDQLYAVADQYAVLIGKDNYTLGPYSTVIGRGCGAAGAGGYNFIQGKNCYAYDDHGFAQGENNLIRAIAPYCMLQGINNTLEDSGSSFMQGAFNQTYDTTNIIGKNFNQGYANHVRGDHNLFQGSYVRITAGQTARKSLIQGAGHTFTGFSIYDSLIQGQGHTITDDVNRSLIQGNGHTVDGFDNLLVGTAHDFAPVTAASGRSALIGNDQRGVGRNLLMVGHNNDILGSAPAVRNVLMVGENNTFTNGLQGFVSVGSGQGSGSYFHSSGCIIGSGGIYAASTAVAMIGNAQLCYGSRALLVGYNSVFSGSRVGAIGYGNKITGNNAFAFGYYCQAYADNTWAHGHYAKAIRDLQRAWASDVDGAQASHIVKHLSTTGNTQTTLLTFNLEEDKAYAIRINLVAWNTTTGSEAASFVLAQGICYRNTGGGAVIVGDPVSLTRLDSGAGAANVLADLTASTNDILLRVTGEAGETYKWCANFEFTEVIG